MVRLADERYCYNEQCLYQWCERCACGGITIDKRGCCATCVPIQMSAEELKAYKRKYFGVDLAEEVPYTVTPRKQPEE